MKDSRGTRPLYERKHKIKLKYMAEKKKKRGGRDCF